MNPSTQWQEHIAPDEADRFAGYARAFAALQAAKSERHGKGRALHRKQLLAATGQLEVLPDLPEFARQGLFAVPARHEVRVRLSNGGTDKVNDAKPDIRGFSFAVLGVHGEGALGNGPTHSQGFALINQEKFAFPASGEFVDFVMASSKGLGVLLQYMVRRYGLFGGLGRVKRLITSVSRPFAGFANENFFSAAPIACGPYAVRVRLVPDAGNGPPNPGAKADQGADMAARLRTGVLRYTLELQPFTDEATTPIEDASVNWPTPYTPVALLTLPQQEIDSDEGRTLSATVEAGIFDPWAALAAHRPLGDVMRARKVVYFESQRARGAV